MFSTITTYLYVAWADRMLPLLEKALISMAFCLAAKLGGRPLSARWLWHSLWGRGRTMLIPSKYLGLVKAGILLEMQPGDTQGTGCLPHAHDLYTVMGGFGWRETEEHLIVTDLYDWHDGGGYGFKLKLLRGLECNIEGADAAMKKGYTPFLTVAHIGPNVVPVGPDGVEWPELRLLPPKYARLGHFFYRAFRYAWNKWSPSDVMSAYYELDKMDLPKADPVLERVGLEVPACRPARRTDPRDEIPF